ncbi:MULTISPECIES: hypothetical protein [Chitinophaga]|uniref:hypothetical protein n=2 Tax=Chitinophagaceae TaxID=563835 RepID=UPI000DBA1E29|nr:hypothetical protein [Chitinophaga ginsengisegetis]MDR6566008.1 hypothetical protein [Chitinophaga ginsengisegetis]MDR6645737.1 hypothetical protein [Chitinophaga ginsengisegetis]MDR6651671.1 hypothetical protein [Chitinophaga ginsengisegetis]
MSDFFTLKFEYKGHPHILDVQTAHQQFKTVYKVAIEEHEITFEPDEEGYVRAVSSKPMHDHLNPVDVGLLHHVAELIIQHIQQ